MINIKYTKKCITKKLLNLIITRKWFKKTSSLVRPTDPPRQSKESFLAPMVTRLPKKSIKGMNRLQLINKIRSSKI